MVTQTNRIPSLDGLRAFSIALVLFGHTAGTRNAYPFHPYMLDMARLGVQIFYLISGFLITFLLLREHERTGNISLKSFYGRRMLRILPVFYSYIAAVTVLNWIGILHVSMHDLLTASSFTASILHITDWNVAHFWSLSTEEQFYVIWPVLLVLLGAKKSIKIAAVAMILAPFVSRLLWQHEYLSWPLLLQSVNAIAAG